MMDFIINNLSILALNLPTAADCSVLGTEFQSILDEVFGWIQLATPCLVLVLCSVDIAKGVIAQDDNATRAALSSAIKRVAIGVAIFFVPILLNFILMMAGLASGTCSIG